MFEKMNQSTPLFSVITVVFAIDDAFWDTAGSIYEQSSSNLEWVIKPARPISEADAARLAVLGKTVLVNGKPDNGIYSAMNLAAEDASGHYLFFLNSGDRFASPSTLHDVEKAAAAKGYPDLIYGGVRIGENDYNYPDPLTKIYFFRNALCHQAYFMARKLVQQKPMFDETYKVLADHDVALRHVDHLVANQMRVAFQLTVVPEMGFSARNRAIRDAERRRLVRRHFPWRRYPYLHLAYAATLPRLRLWLFQFLWFRRLRARLLNY